MTHTEWALRYATARWRVYPVERGRKKALFTGWQTSATTDPELIARQWRREPYPNLGIICGETFAVFDIEGSHLRAFYGYLDKGHHLLPETPICSTGRGGLHIYTQPLADMPSTRLLRLGGVHIGEWKTTGGVVAPPSQTVGSYRWLWWPDDPTPAVAAPWLAALIAEPTRAAPDDRATKRPADPATALDALACAVRDEPEGNRNSILFWAACRSVEEAIPAAIAEAVLRRAALAAGLPEAEAQATIQSAFKREGVRP